MCVSILCFVITWKVRFYVVAYNIKSAEREMPELEPHYLRNMNSMLEIRVICWIN